MKWLFLFIPFFTHSQHLLFNEMNSKIDLPSLECYKVFQDSRGFIWVSTEQGLCRYNGKSTLVYNKQNGLAEKAVYAIAENKDGIWIATSKPRILRITNGRIHAPAFSTFLKHSYPEHPYSLKILKNNRIAVNLTFSKVYIIDTKTGRIESGVYPGPAAEYSCQCDSGRASPGKHLI